MTVVDALTVLHSVSKKLATKEFTWIEGRKGKPPGFKTKSYGNEKYFAVEEIALGGASDLFRELDRLTADSHAFIIRGAPQPGVNRHHTRRLLHKDPKTGEGPSFAPQPRRYLLVDGDHLLEPPLTDLVNRPADAVEHVIGCLSPEFQDVTCFWQLSSSAGLPGSEGFLSLHLWYWCPRPYSDDELTRLANFINRDGRIIDAAVYRAVQPHYIAAPLFIGMADPLPVRHGIRQGLEDELELIIPPPDAKDPTKVSDSGYGPGLGVAAYLDRIGGRDGFRSPIFKAISSFVATHGIHADPQQLYRDIRETLDRVEPGWRADPKGKRYADDDHLDKMLAWIREQHGDQPPKGFPRPTPEPASYLDEPPPTDPIDQPPPPDMRPIIRISGGQLPNVIDEAEAILIANDRDVYAFGDQIVRPAQRPIRIADDKTTLGLRLVPIVTEHMVERFTRVIDFQRFNFKTEEWFSVDCPRNLSATYLARTGLWRLPQLTALATCPVLLADGRIIDQPGFDAASGILFDPQRIEFPSTPERPTREQAAEALAFLMHPFRDFPFVDDASKSVLRSLLLSTVSRHAFPFVPCHGFDATSAGTGKSKLFDCASILLTGRECGVVSQPDDATEFEKKLFAELLAGDSLVSIDNCDDALDSPFLCMVLTQRFVKSRLLGLSKNPEIPNTVIMGANGNNFSYAGDMLRRGLTGHLDAGMEKPWEREFASEDPVIVFKRERRRLVVAALTALRAFIAAGRPKIMTAPPLGGFEGWSRLVRDTILWLGADDPCLTIESARKADPARLKLEAVATQWRNVIKDDSVTARDVVERACRFDLDPSTHNPNYIVYHHPEFRNALLDIAADHGRVDPGRLGTWLGHNKGKVVRVNGQGQTHDCRLIADTDAYGIGRWRLQERQADGWR
jgi:hypothetical protein